MGTQPGMPIASVTWARVGVEVKAGEVALEADGADGLRLVRSKFEGRDVGVAFGAPKGDACAPGAKLRSPGAVLSRTTVTGARVGGHGAPRGERELHMGEAYAVGEGAIPPSLGYVAMGHIHAPQPVPGANVPAEYAGSLLELDLMRPRSRVMISPSIFIAGSSRRRIA